MPLVTFNMTYDSLAQGVQQSAQTVYTAQSHASSGLRVMAPGDDPVATAQASLLGASLQQLGAMGAAAQTATTQLSASDQALQGASSILQRAREIVVRGLNGTISTTDRTNMASESVGMQQEMQALANSQVNGVYLFAGNITNVAPFASNGAYSGDDGVRTVEVAPNQQVAMNVPGSQAFNNAGGQNVIGVLQSMATHLGANDMIGLEVDLTNLDLASEQIASAQATIGGSLVNMNQGNAVRQAAVVLLSQQKSNMVEADAAHALTDLLQAQQAYQAAIAEATRILTGLDNSLTR